MSPSGIPENVSNAALTEKTIKLCLLLLYCYTIIAVQKKYVYKSTHNFVVVFVCKGTLCLPPAYRKPASHRAHSQTTNTNKLCLLHPYFYMIIAVQRKYENKTQDVCCCCGCCGCCCCLLACKLLLLFACLEVVAVVCLFVVSPSGIL